MVYDRCPPTPPTIDHRPEIFKTFFKIYGLRSMVGDGTSVANGTHETGGTDETNGTDQTDGTDGTDGND